MAEVVAEIRIIIRIELFILVLISLIKPLYLITQSANQSGSAGWCWMIWII